MQKQIKRLYLSSVLGNLSLTGAWVAILAARGFSLVEIGIAETVFHIVSLLFEIPSGILADVFGRKKMLLISCVAQMMGSMVMILSNGLGTVCLAIAFFALSYNFSSGSGDALAYDTLKEGGAEAQFEGYAANQFVIYRLCSGISTLCAGFALLIGHRIAYGTSLVTGLVQLAVLSSLREVGQRSHGLGQVGRRLAECTRESLVFLRRARSAMGLMLCNALVGAVDTLLLFFLQAKLPERGIPGWCLGLALLGMEMGGIVGAKLILKFPRLRYGQVFTLTLSLVLAGLVLEHAAFWWIMALGGFLAALGDDALQVRTNARLQDMFPSDQRATLTSVSSFAFSMVMIVLSPLAGVLFSYW